MHLLNVKSDRAGRYGKTQNETEKNQAIEHWKNNNKTSEKKHEEKKKHNVLNEKKKPIERIVWLESIEASMIVVAQLKWVFFCENFE